MSDHIIGDVDRQRASSNPDTRIQTHRGGQIAIQVGRFAARAVGLLTFATLAVLEPFVRFILMTVASLGMFITIVFGFLIGAEGFPKWFILAMSVACFLVLGAYYRIIECLRDRKRHARSSLKWPAAPTIGIP